MADPRCVLCETQPVLYGLTVEKVSSQLRDGTHGEEGGARLLRGDTTTGLHCEGLGLTQGAQLLTGDATTG